MFGKSLHNKCLTGFQIRELNLFWANVSFCLTLKTLENQTFFDVFRGFGSGTLGESGLIYNYINNYFNSSDYFISIQCF